MEDTSVLYAAYVSVECRGKWQFLAFTWYFGESPTFSENWRHYVLTNQRTVFPVDLLFILSRKLKARKTE